MIMTKKELALELIDRLKKEYPDWQKRRRRILKLL